MSPLVLIDNDNRQEGAMTAITFQARRGLIGYHRSEIKVLYRPGLIGAAFKRYTENRALYDKMLTTALS